MDIGKIRNFSVIAHIDHGKSTLADRLLLFTGAISQREFRNQILDDMDLERERGITIKARTVRIKYEDYFLNLIDTPGHVDFTYEVSKSLAACEGALLLVDAAQGVEAQTMTNLYLAKERGMVIVPVVTKTDLPNADIGKINHEIKNILHVEEDEIIYTSAKTGEGTEDVLKAIIEKIPQPKGIPSNPLKALVFDSKFDSYKGVVSYIRVFDGKIKLDQKMRMMQAKRNHEVEELGIFTPREEKVEALAAGEVGYVTGHIKDVREVKIGETITSPERPAKEALPGYKEVKPMVFCGLYPVNTKDFTALKEALAKLQLNDSSFIFEPESSASLGFGFRCGFLGLLHMEITQERLEREFSLNLLITSPNVGYRIVQTDGKEFILENPTKLPDPSKIEKIEEPFIKASILTPPDSLGTLMQLCQDRRGIYKHTEYLDPERVLLIYEMPLSEVVVDFYDKIKSTTRGYGSLNYDFVGYRASKLVKLDILINGDSVDAFSSIVHKEQAYYKGRQLVERLKEAIPRQMFEVVIQAGVGSKIIARDSIRALRKDVTAKCYGGDITRKRKLWEKQKAGKKRMKKVGKVELPQEAFMSILKVT